MNDMITIYRRCLAAARRDARISREYGDQDARRDHLREALHYRAQVYNLRTLGGLAASRAATASLAEVA